MEASELLPVPVLHPCQSTEDRMRRTWRQDDRSAMGTRRIGIHAHDGRSDPDAPEASSRGGIGEHDTKLWRVLSFYVEDAKKGRSFSDVEAIGVDEYSHKGHEYITVFLSHPTEKNPKARVLDIEDGKGNDTVRAFAESFSLLHGKKDKVKDITSDMCHG